MKCIIGQSQKKFILYKHALSLYKLTNEESPHSNEWVALNLNQIFTSRQSTFKIAKVNLRRVGLNALSNRLSTINEKIPLTWLNLSMETYKIKCKNLFLL